MIIKIVYGTQIHLYTGEQNISLIQRHCQQVFKHLPDFYDFFYVDDDGDRITLSSDYDFVVFSQVYEAIRIKKIFIREIDNVLEEDLSDDDFSKLQIEEAEIKTVNLVEEQMMIRDLVEASIEEMSDRIVQSYIEQEIMTQELVENAVQEMNQQIIKKEEDNMLKELVQATIAEMNEEVLCKWKRQQEQLIEEEVILYMDRLTYSCMETISPSSKQVSVQTENEETAEIEQIVDAKIRAMIPQIIRRASKVIEGRYAILECPYCQNSEMDRLINMELLRKVKKRKTE